MADARERLGAGAEKETSSIDQAGEHPSLFGQVGQRQKRQARRLVAHGQLDVDRIRERVPVVAGHAGITFALPGPEELRGVRLERLALHAFGGRKPLTRHDAGVAAAAGLDAPDDDTNIAARSEIAMGGVVGRHGLLLGSPRQLNNTSILSVLHIATETGAFFRAFHEPMPVDGARKPRYAQALASVRIGARRRGTSAIGARAPIGVPPPLRAAYRHFPDNHLRLFPTGHDQAQRRLASPGRPLVFSLR